MADLTLRELKEDGWAPEKQRGYWAPPEALRHHLLRTHRFLFADAIVTIEEDMNGSIYRAALEDSKGIATIESGWLRDFCEWAVRNY